MVRFSKLNLDSAGKLVETEVREIKQSSIAMCPHYITMPEHYFEDGKCKCSDPNETVMKEWGYRWSKSKKEWV